MSLKNRVADQMNSSVFSIRNPWIVSFLIPIFTFVCGNSIVLIIITGLVMVSYVIVFLIQHSKHKVQVLEQEEQPHQEDEYVLLDSDQNDSNQVTDEVKNECLDVGLPDSCSESETIDQLSCTTTEEDSDFDVWRISGERAECSDDGSISDEESLIEIALPGGHYVGYKEYKDEEEMKLCCGKRSPESVLWWPEMNEEENMIEIDLSVGSIMCSRFEIKA